MARIYTRTGDGGETSLIGGRRASKADLRVDLYGGLDELNSALGFALMVASREAGDANGLAEPALVGRLPGVVAELTALQSQLFELGAVLADPDRSAALAVGGFAPCAEAARAMEELIDRLEADLPPLRQFILPGGGATAAAFHVARVTARRVERQAVAAAHAGVVFPRELIVWLNRLSDLLFVVARWMGRALGAPEVVWRQAWPPVPPEPPR